jgi:hypothetical protein
MKAKPAKASQVTYTTPMTWNVDRFAREFFVKKNPKTQKTIHSMGFRPVLVVCNVVRGSLYLSFRNSNTLTINTVDTYYGTVPKKHLLMTKTFKNVPILFQTNPNFLGRKNNTKGIYISIQINYLIRVPGVNYDKNSVTGLTVEFKDFVPCIQKGHMRNKRFSVWKGAKKLRWSKFFWSTGGIAITPKVIKKVLKNISKGKRGKME